MARTSSLRFERVGSDWSLADDGDEILREFGSKRDFVEGEKRKRKLDIERV